MDIFFTYLKEKNNKTVITFLNNEIEYIDSLMDLDLEKDHHKFPNDISNSRFIRSNEDGIILN